MGEPADQVTRLLRRARDPGDRAAWEQLYPAVREELLKVARALLRRDPGHTLQATALIDEALVRLPMGGEKEFEDRREFYRIASGVMRRLLIDHARRQRPGHAEGDRLATEPDGGPAPDDAIRQAERWLAIDRALTRLREQDAEAAELLEVHVFGAVRLGSGSGPEELTLELPQQRPLLEETAARLGIRRSTAYRIYHRAKQFLGRELRDEMFGGIWGESNGGPGLDALNLVKVWDPLTGKTTATLKGHTGLVYALVFSGDGKLVATGSSAPRAWRAVSGSGTRPAVWRYSRSRILWAGHRTWRSVRTDSGSPLWLIRSSRSGTPNAEHPPRWISPELAKRGWWNLFSRLRFRVAVRQRGRAAGLNPAAL